MKKFQNVVVDMRAFTVGGITLGTHADEVLNVFGEPERLNDLKKQKLVVFSYLDKGLEFVIDRRDRKVCKININVKEFDGEFESRFTEKFSPRKQAILREIANKDGARVSEIAKSIGVDVNYLGESMRYLMESMVVIRKKRGFYDIYDPVFKQWLKNHETTEYLIEDMEK